MLNTTSAAVTGLPSENFASGRNLESEGLPVIADIDAFSQQPVEGEGLVPVPAQQAFEHIGTNTRRRIALDDEWADTLSKDPVTACRSMPPCGASGLA